MLICFFNKLWFWKGRCWSGCCTKVLGSQGQPWILTSTFWVLRVQSCAHIQLIKHSKSDWTDLNILNKEICLLREVTTKQMSYLPLSEHCGLWEKQKWKQKSWLPHTASPHVSSPDCWPGPRTDSKRNCLEKCFLVMVVVVAHYTWLLDVPVEISRCCQWPWLSKQHCLFVYHINSKGLAVINRSS